MIQLKLLRLLGGLRGVEKGKLAARMIIWASKMASLEDKIDE